MRLGRFGKTVAIIVDHQRQRRGNNDETLGQLATEGVGITRVGTQTTEEAIQSGQLVPLLEDFNPGEVEEIHAVFVGGAHAGARQVLYRLPR